MAANLKALELLKKGMFDAAEKTVKETEKDSEEILEIHVLF